MKQTETQSAFSANSTSGSFHWFGSTMLFVPSSPFGAQETVRVSVSGNAQDLEGNGLTPAFQRWFLTGDSTDTTRPTISYRSPAPGATNEPIGTAVTIRASEPVLPFLTGSLALRDSLGNGVAGNTAWQDSVTVQFIPAASMQYSARYTVSVDTILRDFCWNKNDTTSWWFQTEGDTVRPTVVSIAPGNGSIFVSLRDSIMVDFSEPMDTAATRAAFSLSPATVGSFTWPTGSRMKFKTTQVLAVNTVFSVTIGTGARDLCGNQITGPFNSGFTTDRAVYAACQGANQLYVMAATSGQEIQRIAMTGPSDVRTSSYGYGRTTYVITNTSPGSLYVLDAGNAHAVAHAVTLQNQPFALDLSADGARLLASNYASNSLSVIDTAGWTVNHFTVDLGPRGAAFGNSNNVIVACAGAGKMYSYPASGGSWQYSATVHSGSQRLSLSTAKDTVYLCEGDQVSAFAASDFTWYGTAAISCYDIVRVGTKLYISDPDNNLVRVYQATPSGGALTPITTIAVGSRPMGLALSGDKALLYTANYTAGTVSVINLATDAVAMTITVGANPVAVAATP